MLMQLIIMVILVAAAFGLKRYSPILTWTLVLGVLAWGAALIYVDLSPAGYDRDLDNAMLLFGMAGLTLVAGAGYLLVKSIAWLISRNKQDRHIR